MKQFVVIMSVIFLLSSCASFYAKQPDVNTQVDSWLEHHQYDKALNTIYQVSPEHPDYPALTNAVPIIEQQRQRYIQSVLQQAKSFEPSQDWVSAEKTIELAQRNLPDAPEFEAQRQYYAAKRSGRVDMDEAAILIARAQYIIHSRPYQESKLYNSGNQFFAQQEFNNFLEEARQISRELYAIGQRYWQEQKAVQARQALTLSVQTAPNELSTELLEEIYSFEKDQRSIQRKQDRTQISEQLPELKHSFSERLSAGDFSGAQNLINEMNAMEIAGVDQLQVQLDSGKAQKVEQLIASGYTLYNSGYIQEATNRWQQALSLAPDNQSIQQQLDRAKQFLNNLDRWDSNP